MDITIHPELQALIPPLTEQEYGQYRMNSLGFGGFNKDTTCYLRLFPVEIGRGWWHVSCCDIRSGIEDYTKRPVAESCLHFLPFWDKQAFVLEPWYCDPVSINFFDEKVVAPVSGPSRSNLYVLQSIHGGPVKIGVSKDIERRLATFQVGCPFILQVVRLFEDIPTRAERLLHRHFHGYRLHGEWFSEDVLPFLTSDLIMEVLQ